MFSRFSLVFCDSGWDILRWGDRSRDTGMMIVLYFVQAGGKQTARLNKQQRAECMKIYLSLARRMFYLLFFSNTTTTTSTTTTTTTTSTTTLERTLVYLLFFLSVLGKKLEQMGA